MSSRKKKICYSPFLGEESIALHSQSILRPNIPSFSPLRTRTQTWPPTSRLKVQHIKHSSLRKSTSSSGNTSLHHLYSILETRTLRSVLMTIRTWDRWEDTSHSILIRLALWISGIDYRVSMSRRLLFGEWARSEWVLPWVREEEGLVRDLAGRGGCSCCSFGEDWSPPFASVILEQVISTKYASSWRLRTGPEASVLASRKRVWFSIQLYHLALVGTHSVCYIPCIQHTFDVSADTYKQSSY